jgi:hypothetical protein
MRGNPDFIVLDIASIKVLSLLRLKRYSSLRRLRMTYFERMERPLSNFPQRTLKDSKIHKGDCHGRRIKRHGLAMTA